MLSLRALSPTNVPHAPSSSVPRTPKRHGRRSSSPSAAAAQVAIGVDAIDCLKQVTAMMKVSDSVAATCLEGASKELVEQPSVLNKLVFVAERALPMPSASAKLCAADTEEAGPLGAGRV